MTSLQAKYSLISIPLPFYFFSRFSIRDGESFLEREIYGQGEDPL